MHSKLINLANYQLILCQHASIESLVRSQQTNVAQLQYKAYILFALAKYHTEFVK